MTTTIRILHVDENPDTLEGVRAALQGADSAYQLVQAASRQAFDASLQERGFGLILANLRAFGFEGVQLLDVLRAGDSAVPVIVLSAAASAAEAVEVMRRGPADYLPITPDSLPNLRENLRAALQRGLKPAAAQAEAPYRALFDRLPIALYRSTPVGQFTFANPAAAHMLGYADPEDLMAASPASLWADPDEWRQWRALLEQAGAARHFEMRMRRRDGSLLWVRNSGGAVTGENGLALYFEGALEDIAQGRPGAAGWHGADSELQALLAAMTDMVVVLDRHGRYLKVAPTNPTPLFQPAAELVQKTLHDFFEKDQADQFLNQIQQALDRHETVHTEYCVPLQERPCWFTASISPMTADSVLWVARDITARKQAEAVLSRYQILAQNGRDIILFIRGSDGQLVEVNEAALKAYGYTREEMLALRVHDLRAPEKRADIPAQMAAVDTSGLLFETVSIRKDGSTFPVEISAQGTVADGERVLLAIIRDITERKQAEAALRESEERYRLLVEQSPELIVLYRDQKYLYINPAGARLLGVDRPEDMIGRAFSDYIHSDTVSQVEQQVRQIEESATVRGPVEATIVRADGQVLHLESLSAPVAYMGQPARQVVARDVTERRRAQQALQESEELYRALFFNAPVGLGIADLDGNLVAFNDAMLRAGGYTREDIRQIGNVGRLYADPAERAAVLTLALRQGYLHEQPVRFKRSDGGTYHALLSLRPVTFQGKACWQAVVEDITERRQSEEAVRQSEAQYRLLFDENPIPMWVCDRDGLAFLAVNEAAIQQYGYSRDEFLSMTLVDIRTADDRADPVWGVRSFQEHLTGRFGRVGSTRHRKKDGTLIDVEISAGNLSFLGREASLCLVNDVTEQKRAEAALKESEEKWRLLVENVPDYILTLNLDHTIQFVNRVAPGFSTETMVGQSIYSFVPPENVAMMEGVFEQVFRRGETVTYEVEGFGPYRRPTWYVARAGPLRKDGQVVGAIVIATDISDRRRAEAERQQLYEQVQAGNTRLQALSHKLMNAQETERRRLALELHDEIGQALTAVQFNLKSLQDRLGQHAPSLDESVATIEGALHQVRNLSLDLRPSLLDDLGLEAALRWYVDRQARRTGFRAHMDIREEVGRLPATVETACFRIAQEALTNVARHAQAREVMIELRRQNGQVLLVVADDGVGFDMLAQWAVKGESLGLLGMEERAALIGGELEVDSAPGRGTEIRAWLPLVDSQTAKE